ncbi:dTDP-4-dehydrorhamnose reductase [Bosea sp. 117]|uniref:dTDP-4-dehydrorhamnose reductase n=1 Tax=Bosea sp. 117 TaxID=1125973 RepID=UPI000494161B|nr:dTDP-4-dehydrorhamnose reductase [Bosea sp. 117]
MRLLVTGTEGQVARALAERAGADLDVIRLGRPELDLAAPSDFATLFAAHAPDVVVSAAAYTAVDKAESEPELAFAVNADGAGAVAAAAAALGVPVIHLSTDYVFDGATPRALTEDDPTGPVGVYGASKLAGEEKVAAANPRHVILRTAWVYAPFGANFLRTMLRLASTRDEVRVVADQHGTPTSALDIAAGVEQVARNLLARPQETRLAGIFHLTAQGGPTDWAAFATEVFRAASAHGGPGARVVPITTADYPTPAKRPAWSWLDGGRLSEIHGVTLPDWRSGVEQVVGRLAREGQWT